MSLNAIVLNCTLKRSPAPSHTEALIRKVTGLMAPLGVESEIIRVVDHNIPFGVSSDEGEGDEWPGILAKVKAANILIIGTPIWFGVRSAVAQLVIERLDGTYDEPDPQTGQYPLYNTVGGVIITGNEDGAHDAASNTLFNLSHMGCVIPPNSDCYWVGDAGPGPSYMDAGGDKHMYTNKTARWMAHNLVYFAELMQENPIPTNIKQLTEDARAYSEDSCPPSHGAPLRGEA
ncbi:MAG: flavodoxin family protein [Alphaproteobacteria bacterium]|nr:flavodoxin family protein [Alphaproteobacteria bacterium]